jgi:hypothetical protein
MANTQMSLQQYLKTYTTVSNKFIDDFFSLYNFETSNTDFVINLDKVAIWLNSQKKNIKETLVATYQEGIDYTITKTEPKGKGRPSEDILLTPTCFKRLSMLSRTPKAEEVRTYFLQIEAHLDKYKNHIIAALQKRISKYEKELKPMPAVKEGGVIYVLKTTETIDGVYKIGRTRDFKKRLKVHQSSHPEKLDVVFVYETDNVAQVENCLKLALKETEYRKRKEFYEIYLDVLKTVIENCACMHILIKQDPEQIKDPRCKYIFHIMKTKAMAPK